MSPTSANPASRRISRVVGPVSGVGLFTGRPANVWFHPGEDGIVFERDGRVIHARTESLARDASWLPEAHRPFVRNTTLRLPVEPEVCVATVEHVLSALAGLGVWNARVLIDGPEAPIGDGSASAFVGALLPALCPATREPAPITLDAPLGVSDDRGASITAHPISCGETPSFTYEFDLGVHAPIPAHRATWRPSHDAYADQVAPARTFSTEPEVLAAAKHGLFRGFSPRDLLVVGNDGSPINNEWKFSEPGGFSTEPARHKLLDLIGDLALLGRPLHARVVAIRSGHALAHRLCEAIMGSI